MFCLVFFLPAGFSHASALSDYNYYSGVLNYSSNDLQGSFTGIYTTEDYMYYQCPVINVSPSVNFLDVTMPNGILYTGDYNRLAITFTSVNAVTSSDFTFFPLGAGLFSVSGSHDGILPLNSVFSLHHFDNIAFNNPSYHGNYHMGFSVIYDLSNLSIGDNISMIHMEGSGSIPSCYVSVFMFNASNGNDLSAVISAINQQTNTIVNNNNSNTDKLLEKPDNNEFSEDKLNGQFDTIQQKMGVLSFGETVLKDFVGIWHSDGDATIYLPEFNMTIQGENYKIWDKYTYNLNELNEKFGFLLTAIRTSSSALLWFMVLQFLIKQYEEFINR